MARRTPPKKNSSKSRAIAREKSIAKLVRRDVAEKIERARRRREAERKARHRTLTELTRPATKKQLEELKRHGFHTTSKGVVIDGPRDTKRRPIKGAKVRVLKGGTIKTSVKQRRDFIYGFTKKEKRAFAKNPEAFTKQKVSELEKLFPSLKRARKKQVRLQWGAYQAQKDFAPSYWLKTGSGQYFDRQTPEMKRKKEKGKLADKLTGLHIVIHVPKARKARKRNEGKNAKKAKGRKRR